MYGRWSAESESNNKQSKTTRCYLTKEIWLLIWWSFFLDVYLPLLKKSCEAVEGMILFYSCYTRTNLSRRHSWTFNVTRNGKKKTCMRHSLINEKLPNHCWQITVLYFKWNETLLDMLLWKTINSTDQQLIHFMLGCLMSLHCWLFSDIQYTQHIQSCFILYLINFVLTFSVFFTLV